MLLFSHYVMSNSLQPHELQHTRPPCPSLSPSLLKLMYIKLMIASNHLMICHPLLFLRSIIPSIRVFSNELVFHIRWPKYCFSFSISPSNEYSGLVSFRIDWFDPLAVQRTLKSLLQHNLKASVFFGAQSFLWSISHILT